VCLSRVANTQPPRALRAHTWSYPCPHPSSTWRLSRLLGCTLAAQVPFFKSLNKSLREEVSHLLDIEYHDRGGIVFRQGQPGDKFYVLNEGRIGIYTGKGQLPPTDGSYIVSTHLSCTGRCMPLTRRARALCAVQASGALMSSASAASKRPMTRLVSRRSCTCSASSRPRIRTHGLARWPSGLRAGARGRPSPSRRPSCSPLSVATSAPS
jgi:hypothetical protein